MILDRRWRITSFNRAMELLTGWPREDALGPAVARTQGEFCDSRGHGVRGRRSSPVRRGRSPARRRGLALFFVQLALNYLWSPVFFVAQNTALALVIIVALLAAIFAFIALSRRADSTAALLFVPYAAWVAFATLLNASIWWLN